MSQAFRYSILLIILAAVLSYLLVVSREQYKEYSSQIAEEKRTAKVEREQRERALEVTQRLEEQHRRVLTDEQRQREDKIRAAWKSLSPPILVRLRENGSLDTTWKVTTYAYYLHSATVQSDGRVIVVGALPHVIDTPVEGAPVHGNLVIRLAADGSIDESFLERGGKGLLGDVIGVNPQSDGSIVVAGTLARFHEQTLTLADRVPTILLRLTSTGVLDSTFPRAYAGDLGPGIGGNTKPWAFLVQKDGRMILGRAPARSPYPATLLRYYPDGRPDEAFNAKLVRGASELTRTLGLLEQPDGKLIVYGDFDSFAGRPAFGISRLLKDGEPDDTFAADPSLSRHLEKVLSDTAGSLWIQHGSPSELIRLQSNGAEDTSFHKSPLAHWNLAALDRKQRALLLAPRSKYGLADYGESYSRQIGEPSLLARLTANGEHDPQFDQNVRSTLAGCRGEITWLKPVAGEKLLGGGHLYNCQQRIFGLFRLNEDGTLDASFSADDALLRRRGATDVVQLPDQRLIALYDNVR